MCEYERVCVCYGQDCGSGSGREWEIESRRERKSLRIIEEGKKEEN